MGRVRLNPGWSIATCSDGRFQLASAQDDSRVDAVSKSIRPLKQTPPDRLIRRCLSPVRRGRYAPFAVVLTLLGAADFALAFVASGWHTWHSVLKVPSARPWSRTQSRSASRLVEQIFV
jgi:hypothetical protein